MPGHAQSAARLGESSYGNGFKTIVGMMFVELYAILPTDKRDKLKEAVRKGRDYGAGLGPV